MKVAESPLPAVLIDERRVGHRLAWLQQLEPGRCRRRRSAGGFSSGASPTFLTSVRYAPFVYTTSVALIRSPGAMPSSSLGSFTLYGIVIAGHEALDLFVFDRGLLLVGVDGQHLALQRVRAFGRIEPHAAADSATARQKAIDRACK